MIGFPHVLIRATEGARLTLMHACGDWLAITIGMLVVKLLNLPTACWRAVVYDNLFDLVVAMTLHDAEVDAWARVFLCLNVLSRRFWHTTDVCNAATIDIKSSLIDLELQFRVSACRACRWVLLMSRSLGSSDFATEL